MASKPAKKSSKGIIGIRLEKETVSLIDQIAKHEGRSRTKQIEQMLRQYIKEKTWEK